MIILVIRQSRRRPGRIGVLRFSRASSHSDSWDMGQARAT